MHEAEKLITLGLAVIAATASAFRGGRERLIVMPAVLAIALLLALNIFSAVIAYSLVCLAMVSAYLFDQERARRLRLASLAPRPAVNLVPALWIAIAAGSALLALPFSAITQQRAAAPLVAVCAVIMAVIAWRTATAPVQLAGRDIASEQITDHANRFMRTGVTCVLAAGIVFVFTSFVTPDIPEAVKPLYLHLQSASWIVWFSLLLWVGYYGVRLVPLMRRTSCE